MLARLGRHRRIRAPHGARGESLRQGTDSVTATTAGGQAFHAEVVVDCAGPDALGAADEPPPVAARPSLPQVAYFDPRQVRRPGSGPRSSSSGAPT